MNIYVCMHVCTAHASSNMYMCVCVCVCMYVCIHNTQLLKHRNMFMLPHTYIHTYIYTTKHIVCF